jgi:drug/metabolite transporter (DMT)-like permease
LSVVNIGLVLLSAVSHSLWNILTQTSRNSRFFSGLKGVWIIFISIPFLTYYGFSKIPDLIWIFALVSGAIHGIYIYCLSRAYQDSDISYVYPIARSAPVFVPVFAFLFLGEIINGLNALGVFLILISIYLLHFDGHLVQGVKNLLSALKDKDLRWAFFTLGAVVSYSIFDKFAMDEFFRLAPGTSFGNGIVFFFLEAGFCFIFYNIQLFLSHPFKEVQLVWQAEWVKGLLGAFATLGSYGLICVVFQHEQVGVVVALRQTSVLMVVGWGCFRLGESFGRERIAAALMTIIGVACASWRSN